MVGPVVHLVTKWVYIFRDIRHTVVSVMISALISATTSDLRTKGNISLQFINKFYTTDTGKDQLSGDGHERKSIYKQ